MTANEVVDIVKKNMGTWSERSRRDTFKVGDPNTQVTGVACTFMGMFDVIKRAHAAKLNLIISHEDTFWNDPDDVSKLAGNKLYKIKTEWCKQNGMVIWRIHDAQHAHRPDQIVVGELREIGIEDEEATMGGGKIYTIPETTLGAFASKVKTMTGSRAFRVVGDPSAKISRIGVGPGYATPRFSVGVDVVVGGEQQEADGQFDNVEYAQDCAALGIPKGYIALGHCVSEQPGMKVFADWLRPLVPGVPVQYMPAPEPYWT
ncbi:MAG TPA: Nif3-like dinuclear metal center hexameric protein [Bryobacteraceae bacterium]|nr:Nif3-like dinuclear metal center hexameric protein [Bryobacteraceae bacterium]